MSAEELPRDPRRAADDALLDALLGRLADADRQAEERALGRVLAGLRPARFRLRGLLQAAVVLLALSAAWAAWPRSEAPEELLLRARATAAEARDRRYAVEVVRGDTLAVELWVRGQEAAVLRTPRLSLGWDGRNAWFVPPLGPVLLNRSPRLIDGWVERSGLPVDFLTVDRLLAKLERYRLERQPDAPDGLRRLRARLESPGIGPREVLLEADAGGEIHRLRLHWNRPEAGVGPLGLRSISFRLVDREARSAAWYGHLSHTTSDRPVLDVTDH